MGTVPMDKVVDQSVNVLSKFIATTKDIPIEVVNALDVVVFSSKASKESKMDFWAAYSGYKISHYKSKVDSSK